MNINAILTDAVKPPKQDLTELLAGLEDYDVNEELQGEERLTHLELALESLNETLDGLQALETIALEAKQCGGLSKTDAALLDAQVAILLKPTGLCVQMPAIEAYGDDREVATDVALEGIGSAITSILDAIDAVKVGIQKSLRNFWNNHIAKVGRVSSEIKALKTKVNVVSDTAKPEQATLNVTSTKHLLNDNGKLIGLDPSTVKDVAKHCGTLPKMINDFSAAMVKSIEVALEPTNMSTTTTHEEKRAAWDELATQASDRLIAIAGKKELNDDRVKSKKKYTDWGIADAKIPGAPLYYVSVKENGRLKAGYKHGVVTKSTHTHQSYDKKTLQTVLDSLESAVSEILSSKKASNDYWDNWNKAANKLNTVLQAPGVVGIRDQSAVHKYLNNSGFRSYTNLRYGAYLSEAHLAICMDVLKFCKASLKNLK